jgi:DNA-binding transcriptional LysR family regulator
MNIKASLFPHLPYLAAVVRTGSFTRAAEELYVSQAAVSYQIRQLEQKLAVTLIIRQSGSQLKLTNAAKHLAEEYRICEKRLSLVLGNLDPNVLKGTLRINAPVDFASIVMPSVLAELQKIAPDLNIELAVTDTMIDLHNSDYDFAIRVDNMEEGLEHDLIAVSKKSVVASPEYLRQHGQPETLADLLDHTLLTRSSNKNTSWQQLFSQSDIAFTDVKKTIVLANTFALAEGAKASLGLAIIPDFAMSDAIQQKTLIPVLTDYFEPLTNQFHLSYLHTIQAEPIKNLLVQALFNIIFNKTRFTNAFHKMN